MWTGRFPRGQFLWQLYSTVSQTIKQNTAALSLHVRRFSRTALSLATANEGLDADGTAPSGRWLCRQPVSSTHANRETEHTVRCRSGRCILTRLNQRALLERVNTKGFLHCLLNGRQDASKRGSRIIDQSFWRCLWCRERHEHLTRMCLNDTFGTWTVGAWCTSAWYPQQSSNSSCWWRVGYLLPAAQALPTRW